MGIQLNPVIVTMVLNGPTVLPTPNDQWWWLARSDTAKRCIGAFSYHNVTATLVVQDIGRNYINEESSPPPPRVL